MERSTLELWEEYCESAHAKSIQSPYFIASQELSKKIKETNEGKNNRGMSRNRLKPDISRNNRNSDRGRS
jgi:hypothetical protein